MVGFRGVGAAARSAEQPAVAGMPGPRQEDGETLVTRPAGVTSWWALTAPNPQGQPSSRCHLV